MQTSCPESCSLQQRSAVHANNDTVSSTSVRLKGGHVKCVCHLCIVCYISFIWCYFHSRLLPCDLSEKWFVMFYIFKTRFNLTSEKVSE